jgi:hypothetical protein
MCLESSLEVLSAVLSCDVPSIDRIDNRKSLSGSLNSSELFKLTFELSTINLAIISAWHRSECQLDSKSVELHASARAL